MDAYQHNTGMAHPLAGSIKPSAGKRATGGVPLTDYYNVLWYGTIYVGTPQKAFKGMAFLSALQNLMSDLCLTQWTLTPGAAISFYPHRVAEQHVRVTQRITQMLALPPKNLGILSRLLMEMVPLSLARNIPISLRLQA